MNLSRRNLGGASAALMLFLAGACASGGASAEPEPPVSPAPTAEPGSKPTTGPPADTAEGRGRGRQPADTLIGEKVPPEHRPPAAREPVTPPEPEARPPAERTPAERTPAERAPEKKIRPHVAYKAGALLPRRRIVAFYGSPGTDALGVLGEKPVDAMLARLDREVAAWQAADPGTIVQPALEPIVVQAAANPGPDSLYRSRLSDAGVRRVLDWAKQADAIVVMDVQLGRARVADELPRLEQFLRLPNVHLALDPEWAMGPNQRPGKVIGSMSASQINEAVRFLGRIVDRYDLPPKLLIVHRFTEHMVTNDDAIVTDDPRVQVVMVMDGWGAPHLKRSSYRSFVAPAPVPFTGFKLFYENDTKGGGRLMTPLEVLQLVPTPVFIQYQ